MLGAHPTRIISYHPFTFPNKGNIAAVRAAHCLCHPEPTKKHPINRLQMALWESLLTSRPRQKGSRNFKAIRTTREFERGLVKDGPLEFPKISKSHHSGQGQMTLSTTRWLLVCPPGTLSLNKSEHN